MNLWFLGVRKEVILQMLMFYFLMVWSILCEFPKIFRCILTLKHRPDYLCSPFSCHDTRKLYRTFQCEQFNESIYRKVVARVVQFFWRMFASHAEVKVIHSRIVKTGKQNARQQCQCNVFSAITKKMCDVSE